MVHLYSAFIQGALHSLVDPIHTQMTAETMQGTDQPSGAIRG